MSLSTLVLANLLSHVTLLGLLFKRAEPRTLPSRVLLLTPIQYKSKKERLFLRTAKSLLMMLICKSINLPLLVNPWLSRSVKAINVSSLPLSSVAKLSSSLPTLVIGLSLDVQQHWSQRLLLELVISRKFSTALALLSWFL